MSQTVQTVGALLQREDGAFAPLDAARLALWYLHPSDILARFAQFAILIADFGLYTFLVSRLTASRRMALLALAITLGVVEFRKFSDPLMENVGGVSTVVGISLLALVLFERASTVRGGAVKVAAHLLYASAVFYSPLSVFIAPAFVCVARGTWQERARSSGVLGIVAATGAAVSLLFTTPRVALSVAPTVRLGQFLHNVIAPLPGVYRIFGSIASRHPTFYPLDSRYIAVPGITFVGICAVVALAILSFVSISGGSTRVGVRVSYALGSSLWIGSAFFAGTMGSWTRFEDGDPGLLFGYMGFGLVASAILSTLARRGRRTRGLVAACTALLVGTYAYGNARSNQQVARIDQIQHDLRTLVVAAGQDGLFRRAGPGATIINGTSYPFDPSRVDNFRSFRYFLFDATHLDLNSALLADWRQVASKNAWLIDRRPAGGELSGALVLSHLRPSQNGLQADHALAYRRLTNPNQLAGVLAELPSPARGASFHTEPIGSLGVIQEAQRRCGATAVARMFDPERPSIRFLRGFVKPSYDQSYQFAHNVFLVPMPLQTWRYGTDGAVLRIARDRCPPAPMRLRGAIYLPAPSTVTFEGFASRAAIKSGENGASFDFRLPVFSRPFEDVRISTDAAMAPFITRATLDFSEPSTRVTFLIDEVQLTQSQSQFPSL